MTYTLGTGVAFTPLEREWILKRLEEQHPAWKSAEIEEAFERLNAQKLVTCPCSEHMNKRSVAVWNIPIIISKLENLEKEAYDDNNDSEDPHEEEEANESNTNSDSGIGHTSDDPDEDTSSVKGSDEEEDTVKPCPDCDKVHSIQPSLQRSLVLIPLDFLLSLNMFQRR